MEIDCYTDPEMDTVHISNSQHTNGGVFRIRSKKNRTTTLCRVPFGSRENVEQYQLDKIQEWIGDRYSKLCVECGLHFPERPYEYFIPPKEPLTLTPEQRQTAETVLQDLRTDTHQELKPTSFVSKWACSPENTTGEAVTVKTHVSVDRIVGGGRQNGLIPARVERIFYRMVNGGWDTKHEAPPVLAKIDGEYYVTQDGNHRTIVYKLLGIDSMYADVQYW